MRLPPLRQGCELYSLHTPHSTMAVVKPNTPILGHNCILHIISLSGVFITGYTIHKHGFMRGGGGGGGPLQ